MVGEHPAPAASAKPGRSMSQRRIAVLAVAGTILATGALFAVALSGLDLSDVFAPKTEPVGTVVRDGKLAFAVRSVDCGHGQIGSEILGETAQGQFCLVTLAVSNTSSRSQTFDATDQKAVDAEGTEYEANRLATVYANPDRGALEAINPGNAVLITVVFDMPRSVRVTAVELHGPGLSRGVRVAVS